MAQHEIQRPEERIAKSIQSYIDYEVESRLKKMIPSNWKKAFQNVEMELRRAIKEKNELEQQAAVLKGELISLRERIEHVLYPQSEEVSEEQDECARIQPGDVRGGSGLGDEGTRAHESAEAKVGYGRIEGRGKGGDAVFTPSERRTQPADETFAGKGSLAV